MINRQTAKILLSKSINPFDFDDDIESILTNNLITNATITITELDGVSSETETLISSMGVTDTWYYNYTGVKITGKEGKTYNLKIIINNDTLLSKTTIPKAPKIVKDDFQCVYRELDNSYCYFLGTYSDPDTIGNCMSIFSKTLNEKV